MVANFSNLMLKLCGTISTRPLVGHFALPEWGTLPRFLHIETNNKTYTQRWHSNLVLDSSTINFTNRTNRRLPYCVALVWAGDPHVYWLQTGHNQPFLHCTDSDGRLIGSVGGPTHRKKMGMEHMVSFIYVY